MRKSVVCAGLCATSAATMIVIQRQKRAVCAISCDEPACDSKAELFKSSLGAIISDVKPKSIPRLPPGREEIGRAGWTILHTFAAYYPDQPSEEEQTSALQFLKAFSHFYPCKVCGEGFSHIMEEFPPRVVSRKEFSLYMCEAHNLVNEQLGKPVVDCNIEDLDKAWRGVEKKRQMPE